MVDVTFTYQNGRTYSGQSMYVVGSVPELGNWDTSRAVKLAATETTYPTWQGTVKLPADMAEIK